MTVEEYMERHHVDKNRPIVEVAYDISFWNPEGYLDETEFDFPGTRSFSEFVRELSELFSGFCKENQFPEDTVTEIRCAGDLPAETKTVLITSGMDFRDCIYFRTDAPKSAIEDWCRRYAEELENGENTFLDSLKAQYQVDVISLSEECIGDIWDFYDEADEIYDLQYYFSE